MVTLMTKFMTGTCSTVYLFISLVVVAACSTAGSQEEGGGNPLWDRTIKPYSRCRTPSRHEDQTFPAKVPQSPHPPLLSAMDPRRVNPRASHSHRTTTKAVLDSSPLFPASPRSTFRSHRSGNRPNRTVTTSEMNHTLATRRMTGRHRWCQQSKTHRGLSPQIIQEVCRMGGFRSRTRPSRQSLVFGRSSRASVRDTPVVLTSMPPLLPGFLVISHITQT